MKIGGGEGPFLEKGPLSPSKPPPLPPKTFVWVNGMRGCAASRFGGVRLPVLRQKKRFRYGNGGV